MKNPNKTAALVTLLLMPLFLALPAAAGKKPGNATRGADRQLTLGLVTVGAGNTETFNDGLLVRYNNGYLLSTSDDAVLINKAGENISSYRDALDLAEENRPFFSATDTIFLHITHTSINHYRHKISTQNFDVTGLMVKLEDNYLHTTRILDTDGGTNNIDFSVTADPASADPFRFRIVFITARSLPVSFTDFTAKQTAGAGPQGPGGGQALNIALQWKVSNQLNIIQYEVEKSTNGIHFSRVAVQAAAATGGSHTYNWLDEQAATGTALHPLNYYYRIRSVGMAGETGYSTIINIKAGKSFPDTRIYPNPVINNTIALQCTGMEKGIYQLRLVNSNGQVVFTRAIHYTGGSTVTVSPGSSMAKGNYYLEINGEGVKIVKELTK